MLNQICWMCWSDSTLLVLVSHIQNELAVLEFMCNETASKPMLWITIHQIMMCNLRYAIFLSKISYWRIGTLILSNCLLLLCMPYFFICILLNSSNVSCLQFSSLLWLLCIPAIFKVLGCWVTFMMLPESMDQTILLIEKQQKTTCKHLNNLTHLVFMFSTHVFAFSSWTLINQSIHRRI